MTRTEAIEKALKLRELARRGEPGERDVAAMKLAAFMALHKLADIDLDRNTAGETLRIVQDECHTSGLSGRDEAYLYAAVRAYRRMMGWVGYDPTEEDMRKQVRELHRIINVFRG